MYEMYFASLEVGDFRFRPLNLNIKVRMVACGASYTLLLSGKPILLMSPPSIGWHAYIERPQFEDRTIL